MSKLPECIPALVRAGIDLTDALALRRCAMQLHRWYEKECGSEHGAVERDETTGKTYTVTSSGRRWPCRDMETPALARVAKIMSRYPSLSVYHQTDPRGAPLYVIRPGDIANGFSVHSCYSRGLAVYK
jgi:hypothetical protein